MAKHFVNLDALIQREDFAVREDAASRAAKSGGNFKLSELEPGSLVYQTLRKPDFQRETKNWTPDKIAELVRGFVDGDLIPSIIMWRSPNNDGPAFVIDGAHRLSALIAWVHDDYGDRQASSSFMGGEIPKDQKKAADAARTLVDSTVGPYRNLKVMASLPSATDIQRRRANNAGLLDIEVQWVRGDATKAEASFFTINQSATEIHTTELRVIQARKKPAAIAARAIIHAGRGHKYWSKFGADTQREIEDSASAIYELLFEPSLQTPIKTLDVPIAGSGYSADSLSLVVDLINVANGIKTDMWLEGARKPSKKSAGSSGALSHPVLPDDDDGSTTVKYLKSVKRVASYMSGQAPRSLGLHPAVYFYSATGRYQPAAFLATAAFFQELERGNLFFEFTKTREQFEEFLVKYKYFINQIVKQYGSGTRGLDAMLSLYRAITVGVQNKRTIDEIATEIQVSERLNFLKIQQDQRESGADFSSEAKSAVFFRKALHEGVVRCDECHARIHVNAMSVDHRVPRRDGGRGDSANGGLTHPYCNTGFKERKAAMATRG